MKPLGTILPTIKQLAKADRHADKMAAKRESIGDRHFAGMCFTKLSIGGETRWYRTDGSYAIVSRRGEILWFPSDDDNRSVRQFRAEIGGAL